MRARLQSLAIVLVASTLVRTAAAEPESRSYAWQTLLADGLGLAGQTAGAAAESPLVLGGVGAFVSVTPILHLVHERPWAALGSFGMRVGLYAVGFLAGTQLSTRCDAAEHQQGYGPCLRTLDDGVWGGLAASALAVPVDALWLAKEPSRRDDRGVRWSPFVQVGSSATFVGLQLR